MPNGYNFVNHLAKFLGETVTIFTTSGGESGSGFTGVLISVNNNYVRLITRIGSGPACSLGNCCSGLYSGSNGTGDPCKENFNGSSGRPNCDANNIGSAVDIPICRIASFVHNSI